MAEIIIQSSKFDFDDILIKPSVTTGVTSRYIDIELPHHLPLFTAPMDTVVDLNNSQVFLDRGINICLPRTIDEPKLFNEHLVLSKINWNLMDNSDFSEIVNYKDNMFPSIGLNGVLNDTFIKACSNILIDVANGHMYKILEVCGEIKKINPEIKIMVGNIANPETYKWYADSGLVDYIRVGIGNGGGCLTTKQSGVGYPMASLIHEIYKIKIEYPPNQKTPAIVADGGMKDYSDVVKALALGADYVMIGSIFNKCVESCAVNYWRGIKIGPKTAKKLFERGFTIKKHFRGMSTKGAQKAMGKTQIKTSEGVNRFRKVEYTLDGWVENFTHYLRNAMSYTGAKTLEEFIGRAEFCQVTTKAYDRFNK